MQNNTSNKTHKNNKKRRVFLFIPFCIILVFVIFAYFRINFLEKNGSADNLPNVLQGKIAPRIHIPLLQTNENQANTNNKTEFFDSNALKGHVTLVNFWGSWCPPCREEHPFLMHLSKSKDFKLVGINYKDSASNARRFLGNFGNPFEQIGFDKKGRAAIDWGVYGPPETFVLDKNGVILYRFIGPMNENSFQKMVWPIIEKANNQQPQHQ